MAESYRLPSISEESVQTDKEIFASYAVTPRLEGVTIAFGAAGELASGQVLARAAATGKYAAYDPDAAATGDNIPRCVLRTHVKVDAAGDALGEGVFAGVLKYDQLVDLDADAIVALGGRADTVRNEFVFGFGAGVSTIESP